MRCTADGGVAAAGTYSNRINDQWRITFRIENNRALDVKIEDYH